VADSDSHELSSGTTTPRPDPTELTDRAIAREDQQVRSWVEGKLEVRDERLRGIDEATRLRLSTYDALPVAMADGRAIIKELLQVQLASAERFAAAETSHLREIDDIRFTAAERLAGRESELNALALAAAFAAQKEASAKEAEYTRIASVKSESATAQAIDKLGELFATQTKGLADKVDDVKDRVGQLEAQKVGAIEQRGQSTDNSRLIFGIIGAIGGLLAIVAVLFALFRPAVPA
jgi:hypothetical protein